MTLIEELRVPLRNGLYSALYTFYRSDFNLFSVIYVSLSLFFLFAVGHSCCTSMSSAPFFALSCAKIVIASCMTHAVPT
jgi:hypothetical protein